MDIYNIEKTPEEIKGDEIRRCAVYRQGAGESFISAFTVSFNDFWNNTVVTPQEHCDAMGNGAVQFFMVSGATVEYIIKNINPAYTMPTIPYAFTINADGTVTIGDKIVVEAPTDTTA